MSSTLLLADDSLTIQKVVELTFADTDFEVVAVSSGEELLSRLPECRPDVIICDVIMPGKDGYQVCQEVKSNPESLHIPVVLLTGTFEPFDRDRALAAGCSEVITKPFEARKLVEAVERLVKHELAAGAEPEQPWGNDGGFQPLDSYGGDDDLDFGTRLSVPRPDFADDPAAETGDSFGAPDELPPLAEEPPAPVEEPQLERGDFGEVELGAAEADDTPPPPFTTDAEDDFAFGEPAERDDLEPRGETAPDEFMDLDAAEASAAEEWAPVTTVPEQETDPIQPSPDPEPQLAGGGYAVVDARGDAGDPFGADEPPEEPELETGPVAGQAPEAEVPAFGAPVAAPVPQPVAIGELSQNDIDRIARRVLELAAGSIERVAWEVIPDMAEMVVRERIRQLEAEVEASGADEIQ